MSAAVRLLAAEKARFAQSGLHHAVSLVQPVAQRAGDRIITAADPTREAVDQRSRHKRCVREMPPVEIVHVVACARRYGKTAAAMNPNHILHDRAGFGEPKRFIIQYGRDLEGVQSLQLGRR